MTTPPPNQRTVLSVALFAAIALIALAFERSTWSGVVIALLGAAGVAVAGRRASRPQTAGRPAPVEAPKEEIASPEHTSRPEQDAPAPSITSLAAVLHGTARDLEHVLTGIIADEGGKAIHDNAAIVASFNGRDHAARALHAARRMISNVDALSAHLDRDVSISIGVVSGAADTADGANSLQQLATNLRVGVLFSDTCVALLGREAAMLAPVIEHPRPLYGFTPVQTVLPGF